MSPPGPFGIPASLTPVAVTGTAGGVALSGLRGISADGRHTCAVHSNGTVACWGAFPGGISYLPQMIAGVNGATAVDSGVDKDCARFADGTVGCWSAQFHQVPVLPAAGSDGAVLFAAGSDSPSFPNFAVRADGSVVAFSGLPAPDITPPTVSLPPTVLLPGGGQGYLVDATSAAGATSFSGGTVNDPIDGPLPVTCRATEGSTFPIGTSSKPITCSATDRSYNTASVSSGSPRTVLVRIPPPSILVSDSTTEATGPSGAVVSYSATTSDVIDGAGVAVCAPASGSLFPIGNTTVTCRATSSSRLSATATFTVTVVDSPPASFAFPLGLFFDAEATSPEGAESFVGGTTSDLVDGPLPVLCRPQSGGSFPFGTSTWTNRRIVCSATDSRGNTRSVLGPSSFFRRITVTVQDTTPPEAVISLDPATQTLSVTGTDTGSGSVGPFVPTCAPEAKKAKDDDHHVGDDDKDAKVQLCTYLVTDNAGNTTTLVVRQKQSGKQIKASAVSIQYGSGAVTTLPANSLSFEWSLHKDGTIKELNQKYTTGKGKTKIEVEAKYHDGKSDITKIKADLPGKGEDVKVTVPGIDLLRLSTANGALTIAY